MRFALYATASALITSGVIFYAYATRVQFYPTVIYLVTSKFSIVVLGNMALVLTLLFGKLTNRLFLGRLRDSEMELVWENTGYAITETCLALTIFRDEMSLNVVILFTCLLFCKIFHWLCDARVEHIEQAQETSRLTHFRIVSLMFTLFLVDVFFTLISVHIISKNGASVQLLFGFEYMLLCILICSTFVRYCLSVIDTFFVHGRWYNKSLYELYLKLIMDILKLCVYFTFFAIVFAYYGLPIHLIRQLYLSFKTVKERVHHFLLFRRVTANLNERFANATQEQLDATDKICIICREEMVAGTEIGAPKRLLPCGHIFHFYCLRNWFERQLKCPTCRADILPANGNANAHAQNQRDRVRPPRREHMHRRRERQERGTLPPGGDERPTQVSTSSEVERNRLVNSEAASRSGSIASNVRNISTRENSNDTRTGASDSSSVSEQELIRRKRLAAFSRVVNVETVTANSEAQNVRENEGLDESHRDLQQTSSSLTDRLHGELNHAIPETNIPTSQIPNLNSAPGINATYQAFGERVQADIPSRRTISENDLQDQESSSFQQPQAIPSVSQYLQGQIELLQLQLQVYAAQIAAANATREAALATLRARGILERTEMANNEEQNSKSDGLRNRHRSTEDELQRAETFCEGSAPEPKEDTKDR